MKRNMYLIILLIAVDQIIKILICNTIAVSNETIILLPHVALNYVENTGAAWGMFSERILLIFIDIIVIFVILKALLNKKYEFNNNAKLGMSLILAGGFGNLIDRIFRGYVVDYIDITRLFDYPIFNFADICIVVGVILVITVIIVNTVKDQENIDEKV
jgi:signal peptidase II